MASGGIHPTMCKSSGLVSAWAENTEQRIHTTWTPQSESEGEMKRCHTSRIKGVEKGLQLKPEVGPAKNELFLALFCSAEVFRRS